MFCKLYHCRGTARLPDRWILLLCTVPQLSTSQGDPTLPNLYRSDSAARKRLVYQWILSLPGIIPSDLQVRSIRSMNEWRHGFLLRRRDALPSATPQLLMWLRSNTDYNILISSFLEPNNIQPILLLNTELMIYKKWPLLGICIISRSW